MRRSKMPVVVAMIFSLFAIACGDRTSGVGELGRVQYAIHTHYVVEDAQLEDVEIVTGHPQFFNTSLTDKGKKGGTEPDDLKHRVTPSDGVNISNDGTGDFTIDVAEPGEYTIETLKDGDVYDYIEIAFDEPTKLSLVTWTLGPNDEDWTKREGSGSVKVKPGTQATFVPVPKDADGNRLVGDVQTTLEASPEDAVASGENVIEVYEQRVVSLSSPVTIFFLEEAEVEVKLTDESNDVSGARSFNVQD